PPRIVVLAGTEERPDREGDRADAGQAERRERHLYEEQRGGQHHAQVDDHRFAEELVHAGSLTTATRSVAARAPTVHQRQPGVRSPSGPIRSRPRQRRWSWWSPPPRSLCSRPRWSWSWEQRSSSEQPWWWG